MTQLNRVESKAKESVASQRPKTSSNRQILTGKSTTTNSIQNNPGAPVPTQTVNTVSSNLIKNPLNDMNTSKTTLLQPNTQLTIGENANQITNEQPSEENGDLVQADGDMSDFTLMRIIKWLEDIEHCPNMIKPPSQLAWANATRDKNESLFNPSSDVQNRNNNNNTTEYTLSDYDSLDEQIIEYNRVVDKTFHIIHDD